MKKFTKVTAAALAATLSLSLAACGSSASTDAASTASADGVVYRTLDEIKALGEENFFHKDYEATLVDTYGTDYESSLVVEGGVTSAN